MSLEIIIPVIGIPDYWWKKKAFKYAKKNPNLIKIENKDLCYECHRHKEILEYFDRGDGNYSRTDYWKYYANSKNSTTIISKIKKYRTLYNKINKQGYNDFERNSSIAITEDGCRIDGSHRLAILSHIKMSKITVNVIVYDKIFSREECKKIKNINKEYRKKIYNL